MHFDNINGYKWGLQYISFYGRRNAKNRLLEEFMKIGAFLPEIKYIYTNSQSLEEYDF